MIFFYDSIKFFSSPFFTLSKISDGIFFWRFCLDTTLEYAWKDVIHGKAWYYYDNNLQVPEIFRVNVHFQYQPQMADVIQYFSWIFKISCASTWTSSQHPTRFDESWISSGNFFFCSLCFYSSTSLKASSHYHSHSSVTWFYIHLKIKKKNIAHLLSTSSTLIMRNLRKLCSLFCTWIVWH